MGAYNQAGDDGYRMLAAAVIKSAVTEYSQVVSALLRDPPGKRKQNLIMAKQKLEDFFYSDWFETLSDLDPVRLLRKVTEMTVRKEKEKAEARIRKLRKEQEKRMKGLA